MKYNSISHNIIKGRWGNQNHLIMMKQIDNNLLITLLKPWKLIRISLDLFPFISRYKLIQMHTKALLVLYED